MKRYAITIVDKHYQRVLFGSNQGRHLFNQGHKEFASAYLRDLKKNSRRVITDLYGPDGVNSLAVMLVDCWNTGDSKGTIFSCKADQKTIAAYKRRASLMPGGVPRYVRCYDDGGKSFDRYTVVFTGRYDKGSDPYHQSFLCVGMSEYPYDPQGFGQHISSNDGPIDRPTYGHLGKKIDFLSLPDDCQSLVIDTYIDIWGILTESFMD